jgi:hypothetical protein
VLPRVCRFYSKSVRVPYTPPFRAPQASELAGLFHALFTVRAKNRAVSASSPVPPRAVSLGIVSTLLSLNSILSYITASQRATQASIL